MNDKNFLLEYEKLLNKGYCDCNEMNCIDNNSPRRILRIAKRLQQENQELKKQLEDYKKWYQDELEENAELSDLWINRRARVIELENHQKEFIDWLEDCINKTDYELNVLGNYKYLAWSNAYKSALAKYKEIIGVKDEM